jgi:hypothetical protein
VWYNKEGSTVPMLSTFKTRAEVIGIYEEYIIRKISKVYANVGQCKDN